MRLFTQRELERYSYHELYEICREEKIVQALDGQQTRQELINLLLKYRGEKPKYAISKYKENGIDRLQYLFDDKLGVELHDNYKIKIPNKITFYKDINLTEEDNYEVILPDFMNCSNAYLVNSNNYLCGIFSLKKDIGKKDTYYIESKKDFFRLDGLKNKNYSLIFFNDVDSKAIFNCYYELNDKIFPFKLDYYKIKLHTLEIKELEESKSVLCIDFGTTNTAAGCYLDPNYVDELPLNDILNKSIELNEINYLRFPVTRGKYSKVLPTTVYVHEIKENGKVDFIYGHEVDRKLKKNSYLLDGTIFYGIKKWVHDYKDREKIFDESGRTDYIERSTVIKAYIEHVIERAMYQFKCKFKKLYISSPVKLKYKFLEMFQEILPNYEILSDNVLDEGMAVLYNTIDKQMKKNLYDIGDEYKALIIDCGGGTTELCSCKFEIDEDDISYNLNMTTTYENGEDSFGGNNLTYRIMQYIKIILAKYYNNKIDIDNDVNTLFDFDNDRIFRLIDNNGITHIYDKLDMEYEKSERIIPTKFKNHEHKTTGDYKKIKNNFYFLWNIAELIKKDFFESDEIIRAKFSNLKCRVEEDLHIVKLNKWNINVMDDGNLKTMESFPNKVFNIREITKLINGDIYELLRKFLASYYETGELFDYSIVKLSGQSCKINVFKDVLKEFIPGRIIEFNKKKPDELKEENLDFKLECLQGVIKFLHSKRFGEVKVDIKNDIPLVPYSVIGRLYNGKEKVLLESSQKADMNLGSISKPASVLELKLLVKNSENELKREYIYSNREHNYEELDEQEILEIFDYKISQEDTDSINNGVTKFFTYTDESNWGFYVHPVKREDDQLYLGRKRYYPFESPMADVSFFNGLH